MSDGVDFKELTDFQEKLLKEVDTLFPKETAQFLKNEGKKLSEVQKNIAKNVVGTSKGKKKNWKADKSYHKKFKTGKIYNYSGDKCVRAYNGSPHGHLIEYGHKTQNGKFVPGKHVIEQSENKFRNDFIEDCENFLGEYFDNIG